ncbi:MAG: S8 family serine peptidase [Polyangiaceae bacterium]
MPVFITARDAACLDRLASLGVPLRSRAGAIATATVTVEHLTLLEGEEGVLAVEWTGGAKPTSAGPVSYMPVSARKSMGIQPAERFPLDGTGTCVGVVDSGGIDLYHPDFVDERSVSRFHCLWDQTARASDGHAPREWGYGTEYTRRDLLKELDPNLAYRYSAVDHRARKQSHATMVASVAAGGGEPGREPTGIAPGARLIYVETFGSGEKALASMIELAEAVDYIFRRAESIPSGKTTGLPCVVNVSLGDDLGPRDGTSPVERFFDALLAREGRAIVIAAGNSAARRKHATGTLDGADRSDTLRFVVGETPCLPHVVIEVWFPKGAGLGVEITAPGDGGSTGIFTPEDRAQAFVIDHPRAAGDVGDPGPLRGPAVSRTHVIVSGADPYPNSENGLLRVEIFSGEDHTLFGGEWQIALHGRGGDPCEWHAWIDHPTVEWCRPTADADLATTITSPGTCQSAITVGAYDTSTGLVAEFSGRGPARGGVPKPDLVACGMDVVAASASTPGRYLKNFSGTSAAAPQVSGAAALLFQKYGPAQTAAQIKAHLLRLADRQGLSVPDAMHGFGRARLSALPSEPQGEPGEPTRRPHGQEHARAGVRGAHEQTTNRTRSDRDGEHEEQRIAVGAVEEQAQPLAWPGGSGADRDRLLHAEAERRRRGQAAGEARRRPEQDHRALGPLRHIPLPLRRTRASPSCSNTRARTAR